MLVARASLVTSSRLSWMRRNSHYPKKRSYIGPTSKRLSRQDGSVPALCKALAALEPVITSFFENVLVMDDDLDIRQNRLALLQAISKLAVGIADLSQLEGF